MVMFTLMVLMVASWLGVCLIMMVVPVCIGRLVFSLFLTDNHRVYELYTAATGAVTDEKF